MSRIYSKSMLPLMLSLFAMDDRAITDNFRREKGYHICKHPDCRKEFRPVSSNKTTFCSAECFKSYYKLGNK